jgi:hypothetical protein
MGGNMAHEKLKTTTDVEAFDIPTMLEMSDQEYTEYLHGGLLFVDHHDVLRSGPAEYPLAVTREQLVLLIKHLQTLQSRVGGDAA